MNMEVKSVRKSPLGLARKRRGTKAHCPINASPPLSSTKKKSTFRAIKAYVTTGTVRRVLSSSPMGNISFFSFDSDEIGQRATPEPDRRLRMDRLKMLPNFGRNLAIRHL